MRSSPVPPEKRSVPLSSVSTSSPAPPRMRSSPAPPLMRSLPRPPLMSSLPRPPLARSSPACSETCSLRALPLKSSAPGLPPPAAIAEVANARVMRAPARAAVRRMRDMVVLRDPWAVGVLGSTSVPRTAAPGIRDWPQRAMGPLTERLSSVQEREDGEDAAVVGVRRGQAELAEDVRDVFLDGALGHDEARGDRVVRPPLGHQPEHFALARGELVEHAVLAAAAEELGDRLGVHRRAALRHAPDGVDELAHVGDAVLEQVADAAAAIREQLGRERPLDVLRQDEPRQAGHPRARLQRGADALVGERRRQADVDDAHVGLVAHHGADEPGPVLDRGDDLEAALRQQAGEPVAQQREALGDHDPHGSSACRRVGPPGGLASRIAPSSASMRLRRPVRPLPDGSAPPTPSSATWTTRRSPSRETSTVSRVAPLCFTAFVSASATTKYAAASTAGGTRCPGLTDTAVGSFVRAASERIASASPRSASRAGRIPRARSRSSASACLASSRAFSTSSRAPSGARSKRSSAMPRSRASATSRACAPSWRSRSMRSSSAAAASTAPARVSVSTPTRSSSSSASEPSSSRARAPVPEAVPRTSATVIGSVARPMANTIAACHHWLSVNVSKSAAAGVILNQSGKVMQYSDQHQQTTATVKPTIPIGRSSRCQPRSFQVWPSENSDLRRSRMRPSAVSR